MKNLIIYYISFSCLCLNASGAVLPKDYKGKVVATPAQVEQVGDSMYIKVDFDIRDVKLKSRRSMVLTPVLIGQDTAAKLPEVWVKGHIDYLKLQRKIALMNKRERRLYDLRPPYKIVKGYGKNIEHKLINYNQTIAFEPWMSNARLDVKENIDGCGGARLVASQFLDMVKLEPIISPYQVMPFLAYVQPEVEAVKKREMVGEAFLDFVVSKTDIRPDYMNNPKELKKITDMMIEVDSDPDITVKRISVVGYASPEGPLPFNKQLSEGRANALANYLLPRFDYPKSLYNIEFGGENWEGLSVLVYDSKMLQKEQILTILNDQNISDDVRKIKLQQFADGEPYRYMIKEYYPNLRKAICKIDYHVRGFEVAEAKEVFKTSPQNLSLNEMYLVANTYQAGSQEFKDLFETAARLFSTDVTANLNAATAALARQDLNVAEQYLKKIEGKTAMAQYHNTIGVLSMLRGEYAEAEQQFVIAANAGLEYAKSNLEELKKKLDNINQLDVKSNRSSK